MCSKTIFRILILIFFPLHTMDHKIARLDDLCGRQIAQDLVNEKLSCSQLEKVPKSCKIIIKKGIIHEYSHIFWKRFSKHATPIALSGHRFDIDAVNFGSQNQQAITSDPEEAKIWDVRNAICLWTFKTLAFGFIINQLAVDLANECYLISFFDRFIRKYDINSGQLLSTYKMENLNTLIPNATKNIRCIFPAGKRAISPNGKISIIPITPSRDYMRFEKEWKQKKVIFGLTNRASDIPLTAVAISKANNFFVVAGRRALTLWDVVSVAALVKLYTFEIPDMQRPIKSVVICDDGLSIIFAYGKEAKIISIKPALKKFLHPISEIWHKGYPNYSQWLIERLINLIKEEKSKPLNRPKSSQYGCLAKYMATQEEHK